MAPQALGRERARPRQLRSSQTLTPHGRAERLPNGLNKNRASGFAGVVNPKVADQNGSEC